MDTASALCRLRRCQGGMPEVATALFHLRSRSGLLVEIEDRSGRGFGEASPLPGFSADDLEVTERALLSDAVRIDRTLTDEEPLSEPWFTPLRKLPAAARFGLETALLDRAARKRCVPLHALLERAAPEGLRDPEGSRPLAAFLGAAASTSLHHRLDVARAEGYRTFKIKLGVDAWAEELAALRRLRDRLGPEAALRLDANRSLDPTDAPKKLAALAELSPEFVEEPCSLPALLALPKSPCPLALDESLLEASSSDAIERAIGSHGVRALVLKPMLLGGFEPCRELTRRARRAGAEVVFSHLFDGPVALQAAAHLALAWGSSRQAHGLAPHSGLSVWPDIQLEGFTNGHLSPVSAPGLGLDASVLAEALDR